MNLDVKAMLTGDVMRLRYINRWSTCRTIGRETVAEHTAFVVLFSMLIAQWLRANDPKPWVNNLNMGKLLVRAAVHDIEESRTGDFPRSFKHLTPELHEAIDAASRSLVIDIFRQLYGEDPLISYLWRNWMDAKADDTEGRIVRFADFLSGLSFILEEGRMGNRGLGEHKETISKYMRSFLEDDKFLFLRPLALQAEQLLAETIP